MNFTQIRTALNLIWRLKKDGSICNLPIFTLVGDTGVGKSTLLQSFANTLKRDHSTNFYESKFLAQVEVGDLIGMPDRKGGKTVYLAPDWWPESSDTGLLFFDELSDAKADVRSAIMPLLLTGKLHQNVLPNGILIICAMNPVGGEFGGYTFTRQFKDRLAFIKATPTIEEWIVYANNISLPLYSRNMISEQPEFFLDSRESGSDDGDWKTDEYYEGTPSRRSVTAAIQVYEQMTNEEKEAIGSELLTSIAGPAAAAGIIIYSRRTVSELTNPKDIYNEEQRPVVLMTISSWVANSSLERLGSFIRLTKAMIKSDGIEKSHIKPLADLTAILPEDMAVGLLSYIRDEVPSGKARLLALSSANPEVFRRISDVMKSASLGN